MFVQFSACGDALDRSGPAAGGIALSGAISMSLTLTTPLTETQRTATRRPVCIVDDDVGVCDSLSVLLKAHGFAVLAFASAAEFLEDNRCGAAECLIIDQHMPGLDGLGLIEKLRRDRVFVPAILITGRLDPRIAQRAGELGVRVILEKPFPVARLVGLIRGAVATD
jgi:FixJ family two-component response regulator